ncbi:MAG: glycerol-3-phosphate responsive antiterminator [Clostridia bacterium]
MQYFLLSLSDCPVIASARDLAQVERAGASGVSAIFLLGGSILTLGAMADCARASGKRVFVHLDLLAGLGRDAAAVEWCAGQIHPDGVISTRAPLLKRAGELGLITIQRLFVMDSASLTSGVKFLKNNAPDMLEVLPGLVPKAITHLSRALKMPIIAGGMITEPGEVAQALRAGAVGVSTSTQALWSASKGAAV